MAVIRCWHPNCSEPVSRGRVCCPRHWHRLSTDIKSSIRDAEKQGDFALDAARDAAIDYFRERMIGDNEICPCRYCGSDIVWLDGRNKPVPVEANGSISDDDTAFDRTKHSFHRCPEYSEALGQRRSA